MPEMTATRRATEALGVFAHAGGYGALDTLYRNEAAVEVVAKEIRAAVANERGRCAKVAREQPGCGLCASHGFPNNHGESTAAAIEKGPE